MNAFSVSALNARFEDLDSDGNARDAGVQGSVTVTDLAEAFHTTSTFNFVPPVAVLFNPQLPVTIERCIRSCRLSCLFTVYTFDTCYRNALDTLVRRMGHPNHVEVRVLLCKSQVLNPSTANGRDMIRQLANWGVPMRMIRPPGRGSFNLMHMKLWIFDRSVLCVGSMNASESSTKRCFEAGIFTRHRTSVDDALIEYERLWGCAEELPPNYYSPPVTSNPLRQDRVM